MAILDFLYSGETNVYRENLDCFLSIIAEELEMKGLMRQEEEMPVNPSGLITLRNAAFKGETRTTKVIPFSSVPVATQHSPVWTVAKGNQYTDDMQKLDEQINSMMTKSSQKNIQGRLLYVCNVCGKESKHGNMKKHIEEPD